MHYAEIIGSFQLNTHACDLKKFSEGAKLEYVQGGGRWHWKRAYSSCFDLVGQIEKPSEFFLSMKGKDQNFPTGSSTYAVPLNLHVNVTW